MAEPERLIEPRKCWIDEDGKPGPGFISSEHVVKGLMRTYKQCASTLHKSVFMSLMVVVVFSNLDDPQDTSFHPHPTNYPTAELEYPNSGASERYAVTVIPPP
jgi:H3 lysine-79-specific histone-lysine N-methyltransferase